MFESQTIVAERDAELQALECVLQPLSAPPVTEQAHQGFQLPRGLWLAMLGCYATFFAAISLATGGSGPARFAIVVSVLYTAIYFGVARIGARQAGREDQSPLERGRSLDTWTGPMDARSVFGQILIVPFAVAIFGIAVLAITAFAGPHPT